MERKIVCKFSTSICVCDRHAALCIMKGITMIGNPKRFTLNRSVK